MKLRLLLTAAAVVAATLLPSAASAGSEDGRGKFLSLPPDLTTKYLQGHYPHRDPVHPNATYRHRKLRTADTRHVERYNGEVETIPAGELCDFPVDIRQWGTRPVWQWTNQQGDLVYEVSNPDLRSKFSANGRSFWSIDEGWDYVWFNRDGTVFVEGTGTHLWIHDKHRKFRQYGTWHLLFGPEGLLYEKYFRDKTFIWDGTFDEGGAKICQFLAPRAS
jgi:hypothetical protein